MANVQSFSLPKEHKLTITLDAFASGQYWQAQPGQEPGTPVDLDPGTTYVIGPFNNDRSYELLLNAGSATRVIGFAGTEKADVDALEEALDGFTADFTSPQAGDLMQYDGQNWINITLDDLIEINQLSDVEIDSPVIGNFLGFDGEDWVNINPVALYVQYDNATSGLSAEDTQAAIDELDAAIDNLTVPPAQDVSYDNQTSGLIAENVQDAIDEIDGRLDTVENTINGYGTMVNEDASDYTPTSGLSAVAISGSYNDLLNKPTIISQSKLTAIAQFLS